MRQTRNNFEYYLLTFLLFFFYSCEKETNNYSNQGEDNGTEDITPTVIPSVINLTAEATTKANELKISWENPSGITAVALSYWIQESDESSANSVTTRVYNQRKSTQNIIVPQYGTYHVSAVAMDNYGKRSEPVEITATPAETDFVFNWSNVADSCTYVLIEQFMNKSKGTFWSTPKDISHSSQFIYWQQAHAMDVVIYSYERIKKDNPDLATTYENYFRLWYQNHANNYEHKVDDETGFYNNFTDDMCWICLTLMHLSEATGDDTYLNTAKTVYDKYIITRAWTDDKGTGLPWKADDKGRNACTNSPGCLIAAKLYKKYKEEKYKENAQMLYQYMVANYPLKEGNGKVEEPPLTYTQGTFGEACRQLYYITGESQYMRMAEKAINYAATSDRCLRDGLLRDEGTSMDQSIFKAVYIPYAVNLALDENAQYSIRTYIKDFIEKNANALRKNLQHQKFPRMYCDIYWGWTFDGDIASMGAQASGASLMEGVARLNQHDSNANTEQ